MRMNAEDQSYETFDVYSGLDTPYSSDVFAPDGQEFSLKEVQEKLGTFAPVEESIVNENGVRNDDFMPSQQTLLMRYQKNYQSNVAAAKKLTTKTKVTIICYVAIVLALILGISLASVSVSGVYAETAKLTADYNAVLDEVAALEATLAVEDAAALTERAEALGYIDSLQGNNNTCNYTQVETRPAQNFHIESNWFDSLCDWLCNAFGG